MYPDINPNLKQIAALLEPLFLMLIFSGPDPAVRYNLLQKNHFCIGVSKLPLVSFFRRQQ